MGCTLTVILVPFSTKLWMFITLLVIKKMLDAMLDLGMNITCYVVISMEPFENVRSYYIHFFSSVVNIGLLALWQKKADAQFQAAYCIWSLGGTMAPFIAKPFLVERLDKMAENETMIAPSINISNTMTTVIEIETRSNIEIPYGIVASFCFVTGIMGLILYIIGKPGVYVEHMPAQKSCKDLMMIPKAVQAPAKFALPMLFLFFMYFFFLCGAQVTMYTWMYTYAVEGDLQFTRSEAAIYDSTFKGCYTIGRVVSVILAKILPVQIFLPVAAILSSCMSFVLMVLGHKSKASFYAFSCLHQFCIAPLWGGAAPLLDKYMRVTSMVYIFSNMGSGIAAFGSSWFTGWLFANKDPRSVLYYVFACNSLVVIVLIIMILMGTKQGNRHYYECETKEVEGKCDETVVS